MDTKIIKRLVWGKIRDPGTYFVAVIVGTFINLYGQILVPWLKGSQAPLEDLMNGFQQHPGTSILSICLGFAFPFCVGIYSSVATRYKLRRVESVANFPNQKPDPVFRVDQSGTLLEAGDTTLHLFQRHGISHVTEILGNDIWLRIQQDLGVDPGTTVIFKPERCRYSVAYVPTSNNSFNIYLTSLGSY